MNVVELTQRLVHIPSVSGEEQGCVDFLHEYLPDSVVSGRNVWASRGSGSKTLLLNSHTLTVPPSSEWSIDPHTGELRDGKVHGLGANDAKGPLAALVCAFLTANVPDHARLILAATCDEETGGEELEVLRKELPPIEAAIVGEPTTMTVCSCQRGLLRLRLRARGRRAHAARPWQGENAIEKAGRDIVRLAGLEFPEHALLGPGTLQVTMIDGGIKVNVVPPECVMEIDARTVPELGNRELHDRVCELVESEVTLVSERFQPVETPVTAAIVQAALTATHTQVSHAFGGVSDFHWVRDVPAIVMGPGRSEQSHAADEWIEVEQLERAVAVYVETIERYFG